MGPAAPAQAPIEQGVAGRVALGSGLKLWHGFVYGSDQVDAAGDDDGGTEKGSANREGLPKHPVQASTPHQRRVLKWRNRRCLAVAKGLRDGQLAQKTGHAKADDQGPVVGRQSLPVGAASAPAPAAMSSVIQNTRLLLVSVRLSTRPVTADAA